MQRILEPEVMDDMKNVHAYKKADFSEVNKKFVSDFISKFPNKTFKNILDIGCGPGEIPILLASMSPNIYITAVDASENMLNVAKESIKKAKLENQISLVKGYLPGLPIDLHKFDAIISNSVLHHLPNPMVLWEEVLQYGKNNAVVFIMDLFRPSSKEKAREIVEAYASDADDILKEDFYNSLLAAFTPEEISLQLKKAKLNLNLEIISDRHLLVSGTM